MEKIVTFRHFKKMMFDPKRISDKQAGDELIEQCLEAGYVPTGLQFKDDFDELKIQQTGYRIAYVTCGYAGKKKAREIGYQEQPEMTSFLLKRTN